MLRSEFHMNGVNCNPDTFDLESNALGRQNEYVQGTGRGNREAGTDL